VLAAGRATGLSTAAIHRCNESAQRLNLPCRRLTSTTGDELKRDLGRGASSAVMVLDLSRNPEFEERLSTLKPSIEKLLQQHDRYLVIAVEERFRLAVAEAFEDSVFALKRLEPRQVFDHYFQRSDEDFAAVFASEKRFLAPLRDAWPPRARKMAEVMNGAEPGLTPEEFHERLDDGRESRAEKLHTLMEDKLDAEGRAVLIAAAVLETSAPRVIADGAVALAERIRGTGWATDPLDEPGVNGRLRLLDAIFHADGRNFTDTHLAESVLPVVWEEFPSWQPGVEDWLDHLFDDVRFMAGGSLKWVPDRIFELAAGIPDASVLLNRVSKLADSPLTVVRDMAGLLLASGAISATIGPSVRQRLYSWSRSASAPIQLAVAAACSHDAYLSKDPNSAFTRLRQLAQSEHDEVREKAEASIAKSWRRLGPEQFLSFLGYCLDTSDRGLRRAVPEMFIEVYQNEGLLQVIKESPGLICADESGEVREFWRLLLDVGTAAEVGGVLNAWTDMAAQLEPADGIAMAEIPVRAVPPDYRRLGKLAHASASPLGAFRPGPGRGSDLSARILNRLFETEVSIS
jgi:hypothetical protein